MKGSSVVYMSCYGTMEQTEWLPRRYALAVVRYLKSHVKAYPLYMVNADENQGGR